MLWKIVNNTSQLVDFFAPMKPGFKEEWFKGIIHQVYGETQGRNVSLRDINKRALDCMLESIRKMSAEKRPLVQGLTQGSTSFTQGSTTFMQGSTAFTQASSLTPSVQTSASFRALRVILGKSGHHSGSCVSFPPARRGRARCLVRKTRLHPHW